VLALEHRQIPPSLHFEEPSPEIDFAASPFFVNTALLPWRSEGAPRRAVVNSFGIGGANATVVLEEAPLPAPSAGDADGGWLLLPLSARTGKALATIAERLADHLRRHPEVSLADAAFTLQVGRRAQEHRLALLCRADREGGSGGDALRVLTELPAGRTAAGRAVRRNPPIAFFFPGAEALQPGAGAELYRAEPTFRREIDRASEALGHDLAAALELREPSPELARRLSVAVEVALARTWKSWGIEPASIVSRGTGDLAAACVAGTLPLGEALALAARGEVELAGRPTAPPAHLVVVLGTASPALPDAFPSLPAAGAELPEPAHLRLALGRLWAYGAEVDWPATAGVAGRRIPLPTYPFDRQPYWIEAPAALLRPDWMTPPPGRIAPEPAEPLEEEAVLASDALPEAV
jgi:phthiocerol/phenolphthiocerol synthesis type-I polyketide synthase E